RRAAVGRRHGRPGRLRPRGCVSPARGDAGARGGVAGARAPAELCRRADVLVRARRARRGAAVRRDAVTRAAAAGRRVLVGLALGVTIGLGVAMVTMSRAIAGQRYWASGYHRLVFFCLWERFDWWAATLGGVAVVVAALVGFRRQRAPRLVRASML